MVNEDNLEYGIEGGNDTQDKIFLLSIDEISNSAYGFLPYKDADTSYVEDKARQRINTAYVAYGGTIQSSKMKNNNEYDLWWLRSPGYFSAGAARVCDYGGVSRRGISVTDNKHAVCPALHINLLSSSTWSMAESVTVQR